MSKQTEDPKQKAEAEASEALGRGDWKAALTSLAHAVQGDPFRTEWMALVDRALDAGGSEVSDFLKKGSRQPYLGFEALKTYAAHRAGDHATALNELENLTRNFPNTPFTEAWGFGAP